MASRSKLKHEMSLRAKFKDDNVVELVVIDHDTTEEFLFDIRFRSMSVVRSKKQDEAEAESCGESPDDKDSDNI